MNGINFVQEILRCWREGKVVTILAWHNRSDRFDENFSSKQVVFLEPDSALSFIPQKTGLLLSAPHISHSDVEKAGKQTKLPLKY